jgi:hypothetical protein
LRPQAPEACASANSATPAFHYKSVSLADCLIIIPHRKRNVNIEFEIF